MAQLIYTVNEISRNTSKVDETIDFNIRSTNGQTFNLIDGIDELCHKVYFVVSWLGKLPLDFHNQVVSNISANASD